MRATPPIEITEARFTSSTVAEPHASEVAYDPLKVYRLGDRVISTATHRTFESLSGTAATVSAALSGTGAFGSLSAIDKLTENVSRVRANYGAVQNRLEHRLANLATYQENLTASESRIRDVDMAQEMTKFTKLNILQQAGTSMLAQANQAPQSVLSLLR